MEEDENLSRSKRPRSGDEFDDLRRLIVEKENAYEELLLNFNKLVEENIRLKKNMDDMLEKIEAKFSSVESEEDMVTDEPLPKNNKKSKKQKKVKSSSNKKSKKGKNQANAVSGGTNNNAVAIPTEKSNNSNMGAAFAGQDAAISKKDEVPGSSQTQPKKDGVVISKCRDIPIVTAYNINVKSMTENIDLVLGHKNYNLRIMGRNATNIGVCTLTDFEKLKTLLSEKGVNYYTYTPKGLRPYSVVIEGLSGSYSVDDVREDLTGLQMKLDLIRIVKLDGDRWLVQLSRDSDIMAFYNVRYVLRCKVTIRKFKRGRITQCFNCQRFGHTSVNCHMPYRCVKCGGSHGPGKCDIPSKGENTGETLVKDPVTGQAVRRMGLPVKCVNCGVEGHAASSRECPRRIELLRKIEEKRSIKGRGMGARQFNAAGVRAGVSYASAVAGMHGKDVSGANGASPPNGVTMGMAMGQFGIIDNDCKRLFGGGLFECMRKIEGFAREYRTLTSDEDRSRALLGMMISLQHHG